jgi:glycosyltransferase involved in cell wall biosynthesis
MGLSYYVWSRKPDVIHFPWNSGEIVLAGDCLRVLTVHDVIPLAIPDMFFETADAQRRFRNKMQRSLDHTDIIITDSESSKRDILKYLQPHSEPIVIYPDLSIVKNAHHDRSGFPASDSYYLYQGGYDRRKGLPELVTVHRDLFRNKRVQHPLILVGAPNHAICNGFGNDIESGIKEGAIIEKGYVTDDELLQLMRGAIALIYPSHYEGFGYPLLEAMSVGCPVITCHVSSMPEICGDAALYIGPGKKDELSEAILTMESGNEQRKILRERGYVQAKKFSWEVSANKYLDVLGKAFEKNKR